MSACSTWAMYIMKARRCTQREFSSLSNNAGIPNASSLMLVYSTCGIFTILHQFVSLYTMFKKSARFVNGSQWFLFGSTNIQWKQEWSMHFTNENWKSLWLRQVIWMNSIFWALLIFYNFGSRGGSEMLLGSELSGIWVRPRSAVRRQLPDECYTT